MKDLHPIYAAPVLSVVREGMVRSAAHITGGGLVENLPRALPPGLGAALDPEAWYVPPVLTFLRRLADSTEVELFGTFNMGLGMVLVVPSEGADRVVDALRGSGVAASVVGRVIEGSGVRW